jgi:hypothetical protein
VPVGLRLIGDQHVLAVEVEDAELFDVAMGHRRLAVVQERVPGRQDRPFQDPGPGHPVAHGLHQFQFEHDLVAHAVDLLQARGRSGEDMVEVAEPGQKRLGERFGVPPPDRAIQHHFQQLVIRHRIRPAVGEALFQALAMGVAVQLRPRDGPAARTGATGAPVKVADMSSKEKAGCSGMARTCTASG